MGTGNYAWKLSYLSRKIGAYAQVSPLVREQMESLPDGLVVSCSVPISDTTIHFHFKKTGHYIHPVAMLPDSYQSVQYRFSSERLAQRILKGKEHARAALARGEIAVSGQSAHIMALNRLVRYSQSPESQGTSRTLPLKVRYLWYLLFQKDTSP
jgi:hypothetical protein